MKRKSCFVVEHSSLIQISINSLATIIYTALMSNLYAALLIFAEILQDFELIYINDNHQLTAKCLCSSEPLVWLGISLNYRVTSIGFRQPVLIPAATKIHTHTHKIPK